MSSLSSAPTTLSCSQKPSSLKPSVTLHHPSVPRYGTFSMTRVFVSRISSPSAAPPKPPVYGCSPRRGSAMASLERFCTSGSRKERRSNRSTGSATGLIGTTSGAKRTASQEDRNGKRRRLRLNTRPSDTLLELLLLASLVVSAGLILTTIVLISLL